MKIDLAQLLRNAAASPTKGPDMVRISRRSKTLTVQRAVLISACVVGVVVVVAGGLLRPWTSDDVPPASPGTQPTYELQVEGIDQESVAEGEAQVVTVRYRYKWSTSTYPGERTCRWSLLGNDGEVVASWQRVFSARSNQGAAKEERIVRGEVAEARAECE